MSTSALVELIEKLQGEVPFDVYRKALMSTPEIAKDPPRRIAPSTIWMNATRSSVGRAKLRVQEIEMIKDWLWNTLSLSGPFRRQEFSRRHVPVGQGHCWAEVLGIFGKCPRRTGTFLLKKISILLNIKRYSCNT